MIDLRRDATNRTVSFVDPDHSVSDRKQINTIRCGGSSKSTALRVGPLFVSSSMFRSLRRFSCHFNLQ